MNYRHVISEAWKFTQENKPLMMWYSFLPALLTTLVGIIYLTYQFFAFKESELFTKGAHGILFKLVDMVVTFFKNHGSFTVPLLVIVLVVGVLYLLFPTLCQGGLIQIIARRKQGQHVKNIDGVSYGMLSFLPMFEYHAIIKTFSLVTVFTEASFAVRNLGGNAFNLLVPIFLLLLFIDLILSVLFTYTEFYIVLEKQGVFRSMLKSAGLVILSWQHTLLIAVLMLIIGIRVIVNVLAVFLVPSLIILFAGLIATVTLKVIGIVIGITVGIIGLFFTAYINGILHMFANTVWTYTFLELLKEKKEKEMAPVGTESLGITSQSEA